jgi:hypothetical protein
MPTNLAKKVFQVHGVDAEDKVVVVRKLRRKVGVLRHAATRVSRRHGGLRQCALLGTR